MSDLKVNSYTGTPYAAPAQAGSASVPLPPAGSNGLQSPILEGYKSAFDGQASGSPASNGFAGEVEEVRGASALRHGVSAAMLGNYAPEKLARSLEIASASSAGSIVGEAFRAGASGGAVRAQTLLHHPSTQGFVRFASSQAGRLYGASPVVRQAATAAAARANQASTAIGGAAGRLADSSVFQKVVAKLPGKASSTLSTATEAVRSGGLFGGLKRLFTSGPFKLLGRSFAIFTAVLDVKAALCCKGSPLKKILAFATAGLAIASCIPGVGLLPAALALGTGLLRDKVA